MLAIILAAMLVAAPADVRMTAANPAARAALTHPRVAAAFAARMKVQMALAAGDGSAFGRFHARCRNQWSFQQCGDRR